MGTHEKRGGVGSHTTYRQREGTWQCMLDKLRKRVYDSSAGSKMPAPLHVWRCACHLGSGHLTPGAAQHSSDAQAAKRTSAARAALSRVHRPGVQQVDNELRAAGPHKALDEGDVGSGHPRPQAALSLCRAVPCRAGAAAKGPHRGAGQAAAKHR